MTPAEAALWARLRTNQLRGFHFRRQQIIDGFLADLPTLPRCWRCSRGPTAKSI